MTDKALRRAGLDYLEHVAVQRHESFERFDAWRRGDGGRLVLMSTHAPQSHLDFAFLSGDILLLGRESAGVPEVVHKAVDARIAIPMRPGLRSLNVAVAAAVVLGEALRQTGGFPDPMQG